MNNMPFSLSFLMGAEAISDDEQTGNNFYHDFMIERYSDLIKRE